MVETFRFIEMEKASFPIKVICDVVGSLRDWVLRAQGASAV